MTSQGPLYPSTVVNDDGVGVTAWSDPSFVGAIDGQEATAQIGSSQYLRATDFGFSVPSIAKILGVELSILRRFTVILGDALVQDGVVRLIRQGVIAGDDKPAGNWPEDVAAAQLYGGAGDLWELDWSVDDVNDSNFGAVVSAFGNGSLGTPIARIDAVSLTVHYELPPFFVARNAAWDAVDNWADFSGVFNHKYKFDGESGPEVAPHADQLPAIELYPTAVDSTQYTHRQHDDSLTLEFLIYTKTWDPGQAETIAKDLRKALWQSKPGSGATYIQAATGSHPQPNLNITFERGYLPGNQKATLTRFQFTLKLKHDPLD